MNMQKIKLAAAWTALMLTYLLGDVLRIFRGDYDTGVMSGMDVGEGMYLGVAALMVLPIVMILLSLILKPGISRWVNIVLAAFFFIFNAIGLSTYPGAYDKFLIAVSLAINVLIVWWAWQLRKVEIQS